MRAIGDYDRLFAAYLAGMTASGVVVVALALMAYDLADGRDAATVISTALTIKTLAYSAGAPLAGAVLTRADRRQVLVALDLVRGVTLFIVPFAGSLAAFYALVAVFALATAAYTPTYQASVAALKPDPDAHARALSKSRVASEIETAVSPLLAAALLMVLAPRGLFLAVVGAFLLAAALVAGMRGTARRDGAAPDPAATKRVGVRLLFGDRRLRGLVPLCVPAAVGTALVMVNTVPLVQGTFGRPPEDAALALGAFGAGSVAGALLPRLLRGRAERLVMVAGGGILAVALLVASGISTYPGLVAAWTVAGLGTALSQLPAAALIRRNTRTEDRLATYAMHFGLTNFLLALAYLGLAALEARVGIPAALLIGAVLCTVGLVAATAIWPMPVCGGAESLLRSRN